MSHRSTLLIFLVLIVYARCQKNVGDNCVDQYTNTIGKCKAAESCESARNDFQQNGIRPTFCTYSAFGSTLVCCRDGTTILQTADRKPDRPLWGSSGQQTDGRRVSERNDPTSTANPPVEPYIHSYSDDNLMIQDTFQPVKPSTEDTLENRDFTIKDPAQNQAIPIQNPDSEEDLMAKVWGLKLKKLLNEQRRYAVKIINDILFEAETGGLTKQHLDILKINNCGSPNVLDTAANFRSSIGKSTRNDENIKNDSFPPILQLRLTVNNPEMP